MNCFFSYFTNLTDKLNCEAIVQRVKSTVPGTASLQASDKCAPYAELCTWMGQFPLLAVSKSSGRNYC